MLAASLGFASLAAGQDVVTSDTAESEEASLHELAANLEPTARNLWPDTFAGLWHDERGVEKGISLAFTDNAQERVEALAKETAFPRPDLLQPVKLGRSLRDLEAQEAQMAVDRGLSADGGLSLDGVPPGQYDLSLDVPANEVVVYLEKATDKASESFRSRYGDVRVEARPLVEPSTCTREDCRYNLRGGLKTSDAGGGWCSTGFTVRGNFVNHIKILSAAHCGDADDGYGAADVGSARYHGGEHYGDVQDQKKSGRVDAEDHGISGAFAGQPWIFVDFSETSRNIHSTGTWAGLMIGDKVCKSGARTGFECGRVKDKNFTPGSYVTNGERFIMASYCGKKGDSGSAVIGDALDNTGHQAIGIHSGATSNGEDVACPNWTYPQMISVFGHIEYAQNALDDTVLTAN